jgi:o-succinylbenzoate---CoA ligase
MTQVELLARSMETPDAPVIIGREGIVSWAQLRETVGRRAKEITIPSVPQEPGHAFIARSEPADVVELLASWQMGKVPVPLNPRLPADESLSLLEEMAHMAMPEGSAVVLRTSGTSGNPRGVALSMDNLLANVRGTEARLGVGADDVWISTLAPGHVGWLATIIRALVLGGRIILPGSLTTEELSACLDGEGLPGTAAVPPTRMSLVPTQIQRLLAFRGDRDPPTALRSVLIGGAHAPLVLVERALELGWPVALTYGSTEMSSQISTASPDETRAKPGAVGRPMPGVKIHFDASGEVLTRGETLAIGYVGPEHGEVHDAEGWYHTGDHGHLDDEGDLWITGRRIDRIISGGVTVEARDVEETLRSHPAVLDACVVGLPSEEWGETVGAWVEPVVGEFDQEEIDRHLRAQLTAAKLPRVWHVGVGLPRNVNGKVDRAAVKKALVEEKKRRPQHPGEM